MTPRELCICSERLTRQSFSENFDALHCGRCRSKHFVPRPNCATPEFHYDTNNKKYTEQSYLYGKQLRWSHRVLLQQSWRGRKVLEIGCFNGFFLDELQKAGATAYGFDVNEAALEVGQELFKLQGRLQSSFEAIQQLGPFDDVLCIDVIEHVDAPEELVGQVARMLSKGGRIIIAGPTLERRFHDKSDYPPHHKWRFSRHGLRVLLQRSGYDVVDVLIQRDAVLLLRNFIGKLISGLGRKEFYGDEVVKAPTLDGPLSSRLYSAATKVGQWLFAAIGISYCSTVIIATKVEKT